MRIDPSVVLPDAVHALRAMGDIPRRTTLEPRLLELVRLRASQLNGCSHCVSLHSRDARALGESEDRLSMVVVWQEATVFSARERAALAWCEAVTMIADAGVPDDLYRDVSEKFAPQELVALTVAIIAVNGWNRLRIALGPAGPAAAHAATPQGTPRRTHVETRLDRLEGEIARLRAQQARRRGPRFYESGSIHPELDDQTIVPPG